MTWKSGKRLRKQNVALLHHHPTRKKAKFACHLLHNVIDPEWTYHFALFPELG
jgi:hypothetical protein